MAANSSRTPPVSRMASAVGAVVEVRHDGEAMAARQPLEQRPVVRREEGGLGQLIAMRVDQHHVEAGRQPRGIERQALEEVGEALRADTSRWSIARRRSASCQEAASAP